MRADFVDVKHCFSEKRSGDCHGCTIGQDLRLEHG